jgi:hypothetical protein
MSRQLVAALLLTVAGSIPLSTLGQAAPEGSPSAPSSPVPPAHLGTVASEADLDDLLAPRLSSETGLRLYGFADMSYSKVLGGGISAAGYEVSSTINGAPQHWSFGVGNLNLYLDGQLGARARSLAEVRFTYLPGGTQGTTVPDYAQPLAVTNWGGIVIERAWVEYAFADLVTVRAGQFLTPYGIWNVDHGSPTTIAVQKPEITSAQLFPERQVGVEAYGSRYLGDARLGYHLTLSNGRIGDNPPFANYSGRPGLGGRLFVEGTWLGELKFGLSGYTGRYTELQAASPVAFPVPPDTIAAEYDEHDAAADVRWEWKKVLFISEAVYQRVRYSNRGRPANVVIGPSGPVAAPAADFWSAGNYALAGYRLPFDVMPYVMWELIYQSTGFNTGGMVFPSGFRAIVAGVNFRPLPSLVLKVQYDLAWAPGAPAAANSLDLVRGQVAWAF